MKSEGMCALFVDYKSAYNTVNRSRLWNIIGKQQIMTKDEIQYLSLLHDKIYFNINDTKYYF